MFIYLRSETYANESRTPLVPEDVKTLIKAGFNVLVESSEKRIFTDIDFIKAGAVITTEHWFNQPTTTLIVGLKELSNLDKLNAHTHIYFSHSYKQQNNAKQILQAFNRSNSIIYDLEYFLNPDGQRALAFGYHAGLVAAVLGLTQHYNRKNGYPDLHNLRPWLTMDSMLDSCKTHPATIALVGRGRTAQGVKYILQKLGLPSFTVCRENINEIKDADIIFNCITLDKNYNEVWIDKDTQLNKDKLIVDISCDYTKPNNPIAVYSSPTTWQDPVYNYSDKLSIIAIDNLPSLLPCDSSVEFSEKLTGLLLTYGDSCWHNNLKTFRDASRYTIK
jgi:saccharopine dehydrogenase (NAD+, L-lysine-forming)